VCRAQKMTPLARIVHGPSAPSSSRAWLASGNGWLLTRMVSRSPDGVRYRDKFILDHDPTVRPHMAAANVSALGLVVALQQPSRGMSGRADVVAEGLFSVLN